MPDLVFERCLPSARAAEIQALFTRAGQPEFASVYERMYRPREPRGLRSWIGLENGRAVLHISLSLEPFSDGERTLICGLPGDLMAAETHRQFWHPVKLVRRMVADVRKEQTVDFLLTSFVPAAEAIFRAAGFQRFANVQRHVMPLMWPYPLFRFLQHREPRPRITPVALGDARMDAVFSTLTSPGTFRPAPSREYYATRMPRGEYPAGTWLLAGVPGAPDAAVLVSPKSRDEMAIADVLWRDADIRLAGVLSAVARWASRQGHRQLAMMTMEASLLSRAAQRAGFLTRPQPHVMMILPVANPASIPVPAQWTFTPFVLTSW